MLGSMNAPIWRRSTTTKPRRSRRSHGAVTLLPITPLHEIVPGAIDVDHAKTKVVYLAPLTSTAAEKYFARNSAAKASGGSDEDDDVDDSASEDEGIAGNAVKNQPSTRSPVNPLLSKLLADHDKRMARRRANQEKLCATRTSVFDQRSSYDDALAVKRPVVSPVKTKPRSDRPEDEEIEHLKQYVQSMPVTNEDLETFKNTMETYQRLQLEYRASLMRNHASPIGFNMEAAWNKTLVEERHRLWVQAHDERCEATRARKVQEDDNFERRILETTTEHRNQMRLLREVRLRLALEAQIILPTIVLAVTTQNWLAHLQRRWREEQLFKRLRGIVRFWCTQRKSRNVHQQAAHVLINWLQKSVAVKSVAFRVFRGIRNFVRRVKKIQRLWKIKQAKRLRNYLTLEKLWVEHETGMVDQAHDDFERKQHADAKPVRSKKKHTAKAVTSERSNAAWLTFVSADIRMDVINEYVRDQQSEFTRHFRHQEDDLYPQLVQTLRDRNPDKARSYIKAVANGHALLGRVFAVLSEYPGALVGVTPVEPLRIKSAPVEELILKARDRSSPDETGARFGI